MTTGSAFTMGVFVALAVVAVAYLLGRLICRTVVARREASARREERYRWSLEPQHPGCRCTVRPLAGVSEYFGGPLGPGVYSGDPYTPAPLTPTEVTDLAVDITAGLEPGANPRQTAEGYVSVTGFNPEEERAFLLRRLESRAIFGDFPPLFGLHPRTERDGD